MLHEQNAFDRRLVMSIEKLVKELLIEPARIDFRSTTLPPRWLVGPVMKSNATKLARIGEDQRAVALIQHEMIMPARTEIGHLGVRFAGHAKMDSEPVVAGKFEVHLFSEPCRSQQPFAGKIFPERTRVGAAEHIFAGVQAKIDNLVAKAGVPLFAKPLDFG